MTEKINLELKDWIKTSKQLKEIKDEIKNVEISSLSNETIEWIVSQIRYVIKTFTNWWKLDKNAFKDHIRKNWPDTAAFQLYWKMLNIYNSTIDWLYGKGTESTINAFFDKIEWSDMHIVNQWDTLWEIVWKKYNITDLNENKILVQKVIEFNKTTLLNKISLNHIIPNQLIVLPWEDTLKNIEQQTQIEKATPIQHKRPIKQSPKKINVPEPIPGKPTKEGVKSSESNTPKEPVITRIEPKVETIDETFKIDLSEFWEKWIIDTDWKWKVQSIKIYTLDEIKRIEIWSSNQENSKILKQSLSIEWKSLKISNINQIKDLEWNYIITMINNLGKTNHFKVTISNNLMKITKFNWETNETTQNLSWKEAPTSRTDALSKASKL
jgi:hypothetical protein